MLHCLSSSEHDVLPAPCECTGFSHFPEKYSGLIFHTSLHLNVEVGYISQESTNGVIQPLCSIFFVTAHLFVMHEGFPLRICTCLLLKLPLLSTAVWNEQDFGNICNMFYNKGKCIQFLMATDKNARKYRSSIKLFISFLLDCIAIYIVLQFAKTIKTFEPMHNFPFSDNQWFPFSQSK